MNLFIQQKQTHRLREQTYGYQGKGWRGGIVRDFRIDMYTLLCLKWVTGTSLVVQWLGLCLPMQGVQVRSLVGELGSHMPRVQKTKKT